MNNIFSEPEGLITAEDIIRMKFNKTQLVVLSACQTGLGDAKKANGLMGLQYAFLAAGAKCVIISLWAVPDRQTKDLMLFFYQNVKNGFDTAEALRLSQLKIKETHAAPKYWGAFICKGQSSQLYVAS